jgi:hypothetical protein
MFSLKPSEAKSYQLSREPGSSPRLSPASIALSFTLILIELQAVYQGNPQDMLLILIATLLVVTGATR